MCPVEINAGLFHKKCQTEAEMNLSNVEILRNPKIFAPDFVVIFYIVDFSNHQTESFPRLTMSNVRRL